MNVKNENKDYFTVGEIAEILGVNKNTILHYDRENVVKAIRSENNYRYYSKDSVRVFKIVLRLRKLGFSLEKIKEMGKFIEEKKYSAISDLMKQKMEENKREIEEIEKNMKILKSEEKYLEYLNDVNSFEEKEKFNKEPSNFFCIKTCEKEAGIVIDIENIEKNIESQKNFIRKELMKYKRDIPWLKKYFWKGNIKRKKFYKKNMNVINL